MLKKELAKALGISPAMVTKLAARGMPCDTVERAQRWRKRHLEPGRVKGVRFDPTANAAALPVPRDMAKNVHQQIEVASTHIMNTLRHGGLDEIRALANTEDRLRNAIRQSMVLPGVVVRLPLVLWASLCEAHAPGNLPDDVIEVCPEWERDALLTAHDFAEAVRPWTDLDAGQWLHIDASPDLARFEAGAP